jgi:hypothetical protein
MVALLVALALTSPPRAWLDAGSAHAPLAVSSWCWASTCGAPIAASTKTVTVQRGMLVRIELAFAPKRARVAVAGVPLVALYGAHEVSWRATKGGGVTINVTGAKGWVTYVTRIRLR